MFLKFITIAVLLIMLPGGCSKPEISNSEQFTNLDPTPVGTADETYESTVTVYWNDQILRGCGKALH